MQYLAFYVWLLSLNINVYKVHHIVTSINPSFFLMSNKPHFIHQLDIWVFISLLLWVTWTFVYNILCGCVFSFLSVIYTGIESLGLMAILWVIFWGTSTQFPKTPVPFYIITSVKGFQLLNILTNLSSWCFCCRGGCEVVSFCVKKGNGDTGMTSRVFLQNKATCCPHRSRRPQGHSWGHCLLSQSVSELGRA